MPIYEYQCDQCAAQFEILVLPASPAASCPACKSRKLSRMISLCAVNSGESMLRNLRREQKKNRKIGQGKAYEEEKAIRDHEK